MDALDAALPDVLPVFPGLSVTGRYVLSSDGGDQRGDGLKAVALPGGRVALAVVDTLGAGPRASTSAVRLLAVLRGSLESGAGLSQAMAAVDRYAAGSGAATGASLAVALVDQGTGDLQVATAGHPAPLASRAAPGRAAATGLDLAPSRPLGMGGTASLAATRLEVGDVLVLHTNGLLTARDGRVADGSARLGATLERWRAVSGTGRTAEQRGEEICAEVLSALQVPHGFRDDVALLVAERTGLPRPLAVETSAEAAQVPAAVAELQGWLDVVGAGMLDRLALTQAVAELAGNVVVHAYLDSPGPGLLRLEADLDTTAVLRVRVSDQGRWRPTAGTHGGRGLVRAGGLVDAMRLVRDVRGTSVVLEQSIGRPVMLLRSGTSGVQPPSSPMGSSATGGTLTVSGDVCDADSDSFRAQVHEATHAGTEDVRVDLSDVTRLSGPAVQVLFHYLQLAVASGATFTVVAPDGCAAHQVLTQVAMPHVAA
ncbi:MAG: SpoIIE family protein phosphatase [Nocardioides sp.]|uniref:SpoIIE family protein phosphatase n=1 Tax=Nocardioides sp. TaxID=35761 RepID=UPI003F0F51A9